MPVSEATFEQLALEDPEGLWELACGRPRRKPEMTQEHNHAARRLAMLLSRQVDLEQFDVGTNAGYAARGNENSFLPDVLVIPTELLRAAGGTMKLETYSNPLPFVAEVWSPSTGNYDVDTKFPEYKQRGDLEIWRIHPYERTITAWRRQADGSYSEATYLEGEVPVASLPGVSIPISRLFE
jgi:Uma2 family endonuclease